MNDTKRELKFHLFPSLLVQGPPTHTSPRKGQLTADENQFDMLYICIYVHMYYYYFYYYYYYYYHYY